MEPWQQTLAAGISGVGDLEKRFSVDLRHLDQVIKRFPLRIAPSYMDLIERPGDAIWRQCVPDPRELNSANLSVDPLNEKGLSPVPGLIHRYSDRAVWLISSTCATFCRFCMRKHHTGWNDSETSAPHGPVLDYIKRTAAIRDVILSGGDPLLLPDEILDGALAKLRRISHVEIVRIHTRAPVTLPERITPALCRILEKYHPLYVNTHFNHPSEITPRSAAACSLMASAGIPLGNQTVLLRGVNDDPPVMKDLMQRLLTIRIRPYYIHQADLVEGTGHFRTSIGRGLDVMRALRGHTSGLAVPYYVVDLPGGRGKVPLVPEDVRILGGRVFIRSYNGEEIEYPDVTTPESLRGPGVSPPFCLPTS